MGKPTINVPFSIAMLNYQRVLIPLKIPWTCHFFMLTARRLMSNWAQWRGRAQRWRWHRWSPVISRLWIWVRSRFIIYISYISLYIYHIYISLYIYIIIYISYIYISYIYIIYIYIIYHIYIIYIYHIYISYIYISYIIYIYASSK